MKFSHTRTHMQQKVCKFHNEIGRLCFPEAIMSSSLEHGFSMLATLTPFLLSHFLGMVDQLRIIRQMLLLLQALANIILELKNGFVSFDIQYCVIDAASLAFGPILKSIFFQRKIISMSEATLYYSGQIIDSFL